MKTAALCTLCLLGSPLGAQDFLLYRFDSGDTAGVEPNLATGPTAFPMSGTVETNTGAPHTDGRFGTALAAGNALTGEYNRVRTGWVPSAAPLDGDLTFAFWMRQRNVVTSPSLLCGVTVASGVRVFTSSIAGRGLYYRAVLASGSNTSIPQDLLLPAAAADIQTLAAAGWVHVALVVDSAARTAQFYVDGAPVYTKANAGPARLASSGEFLVGFQGTSSESPYDLDEFLISNRAYAPAEIQELFTGPQPRSREVPYTMDRPLCGAAELRGCDGPPDLGNANYGLELESDARGVFMLFVGHQRDTLGGTVALPVELQPFDGCWLLTDIDARRVGSKSAQKVRIPLPIPDLAVEELVLYAQGFLLEPRRRLGVTLHATNGLEIVATRAQDQSAPSTVTTAPSSSRSPVPWLRKSSGK